MPAVEYPQRTLAATPTNSGHRGIYFVNLASHRNLDVHDAGLLKQMKNRNKETKFIWFQNNCHYYVTLSYRDLYIKYHFLFQLKVIINRYGNMYKVPCTSLFHEPE